MSAAARSDVSTVPGASVEARAPAATPSDESAVLDLVAELRSAVAAVRRAPNESAALTMSRASARKRGLVAIVSTVAAIVYALIDVVHDRSSAPADTAAVEDRVDRLEQKVDGIAADVAAIADALAPADTTG